MSRFLFRASRISSQSRSTLSLRCRRNATTVANPRVQPVAARPSKPAPMSKPPQPSTLAPSQATASPEELKKQFLVNLLYEKGVRDIYRAPSHRGIIGVSWLLCFTLIGTTGTLIYLGNWKENEELGLSQTQVYVVTVGNRLGMIFFTSLGVLAVLRYKGIVRKLELVSHHGGPRLKVSVRRTLPFLKPTVYTVPAYDFRLPYRWMLPMKDPAWIADPDESSKRGLNPFRTISKAFYLPFKWFRTYIYRDGFMRVVFGNKDKTALLDTSGWFLNGSSADFLKITTTAKPWESN